MPRLALLALAAALALAGCSGSGPEASGTGTVGSYPMLDGAVLSGRWDAVAALDDADANADLQSGDLVRQLVFYPLGRVVLTGIDRSVSDARRTFEGRVSGRSLQFDAFDGAATLRMDGGQLVLTDPRGQRTVYERAGS